MTGIRCDRYTMWQVYDVTGIRCDRYTMWQVYDVIRNGFDLQYDFEWLWFTVWFWMVLIYSIICSPYIRCQRLCLSRTDVLGTCRIAYIDTKVIPGRLICQLPDRISFISHLMYFILDYYCYYILLLIYYILIIVLYK